MIHLLGNSFLYLALLASICQIIFPLLGYYQKNPYYLATARPSVLAQASFVSMAYLLLTFAFVTNDFSILFVAANSHPDLPLIYKMTAVWGGHEGSILLWVLILNVWAVIFATKTSINSSYPLVITILGIISFGFLSFLLFTSNPFAPIPEAYANYHLTGNDLNPLLQDPGFIIHPPMLYLGYVGFSVAFAISLAALIDGSLTKAWARLTRQFALAAWAALSLGITLGSWWSYRVLGWGGFWFWDPVENASLLPWITGLALIHILMVMEKKQIAGSWAMILAILTFTMSILGTFLVRSGVLISAHTFANDPTRGLYLLLLLTVILITTSLLYLFYPPPPATTSIKKIPGTKHLLLIINSGLLIIIMLTILLGTLYPLILEALQLGLISVGAPYFNTVLLPLLLLIMLFMVIAVFSTWSKQSWRQLLFKSFIYLLPSQLLAFILLWCFTTSFTWLSVVSLGLSLAIIASSKFYIRMLPGMSLAHMGFALTIIGIMLSSALTVGKEALLKPGENITVGPYQFYFIEVKGIQGPNYKGVRATFDIFKNKHFITTMASDKRIYTVRDMVMTKVGIYPGLFRDLYIALGEPADKQYWSLRIYYKPFIRFIWLGGIMMLLGGLLALNKSRRINHV